MEDSFITMISCNKDKQYALRKIDFKNEMIFLTFVVHNLVEFLNQN